MEPLDLVRVHTEQYASNAKASFVQIAEIWETLELNVEEQKEKLSSIMSAATAAWSDAVSAAQQEQQQVKQDIQTALSEMAAIKALLGADDPAAEAELARLQGQREPHRTLRAWHQDALAKASYWHKCKQQRQAEHDELQARIRQLRQLCGLVPGVVSPPDGPPADISTANMKFLELERERLVMERDRREDVVRQLLDDLAAVCSELGEDVKAAAAEAHPSLVYTWDAETAKVMRDVYKLAGSVVGSSAIDLSDVTISRLTTKLAAMRDLQAARSAHAVEVLGVLHSLWDAIDVPASEREHFVKMMSGSLRLHQRSLEKVMSEVRRLEERRAQQMVDLVNTKCAELVSLCRESHVEEPSGLTEALAAINSEARNPGAAAELLAKLLHMLAEVQVLAAKRGVIMGVIRQVEAAQEEEAWLVAYEADDNRYKGRDANKRLQRAIKAGKLRDRLPLLLDELRGLLAEWRECEGAGFMYDGKDYEFEVLEQLAAEVDAAAAQRAANKAPRSASLRRQSSVGGAAIPLPPGSGADSTISSPTGNSSSSSRAAAARAGRPASACSPGGGSGGGGGQLVGAGGGGGGGGPGTPLPPGLRALTARSLSERHSICVVRTGEREVVAGPGSLSRSGEVHLSPARPNTSSSSSSRTTTSSKAAAGSVRRMLPGLNSSSSSNNTPRPAGTTAATSSSSGGGGFRTPPPKKAAPAATAVAAPRTTIKADYSTAAATRGGRDAGTVIAAAAAVVPSSDAAAADGSCKRASTSKKLDTIFRRGSVQHPVARLDTAAAAAAAVEVEVAAPVAPDTQSPAAPPMKSPVKSPMKSPVKSPVKMCGRGQPWTALGAAPGASSGGGADTKASPACDQDPPLPFATSTPSPVSQPNFA